MLCAMRYNNNSSAFLNRLVSLFAEHAVRDEKCGFERTTTKVKLRPSLRKDMLEVVARLGNLQVRTGVRCMLANSCWWPYVDKFYPGTPLSTQVYGTVEYDMPSLITATMKTSAATGVLEHSRPTRPPPRGLPRQPSPLFDPAAHLNIVALAAAGVALLSGAKRKNKAAAGERKAPPPTGSKCSIAPPPEEQRSLEEPWVLPYLPEPPMQPTSPGPMVDEEERVLLLFGLEKSRVPSLLEDLYAEPSSSLFGSIVPGEQFRDDVIMDFCRALEVSARRKVVLLEVYHVQAFPSFYGADAAVSSESQYVHVIETDNLNSTHLENDRLVLIPTHVPGHYIFQIVDHVTATLTVLDPHPTGLAYRSKHVNRRVYATLLFLETERAKHNLPAMHYDVVFAADYSTQSDGSSCGAFVCAYAFMQALYGRLPTSADFTGRVSDMLRIACYDVVKRGRISDALSPAALDVPVGAGRPARLTEAQKASRAEREKQAYIEERAAAGIAPDADGRWPDEFDDGAIYLDRDDFVFNALQVAKAANDAEAAADTKTLPLNKRARAAAR